jgi:hypothetical protein
VAGFDVGPANNNPAPRTKDDTTAKYRDIPFLTLPEPYIPEERPVFR